MSSTLATSGAAAALARAARIRAQALALEAELPWSLATPADARAFAVWWAAEERHWEAYRQAMGIVFDTEIGDDDEAVRAAHRERLALAGARLRDFADFCQTEVEPLLDRLERGLDFLERGGPDRDKYHTLYAGIRQRVREALPVAWRIIAAACHAYRLLDEDLRAEAEATWGPLTGTDPHDYSPVWHKYFPTRRLVAIDLRYRQIMETPPDDDNAVA